MVTIYTKTGCPYCVAAKENMQARGVDFAEVNLSLHPERIPEIVQLTNKRIVPVIAQVNGTATSGWEGGG